MANKDTGVVNIHGKEYLTVARRISDFRGQHPQMAIQTELVSSDMDMVVMKASILDIDGKLLATGYAEEARGSTNINRTSALENCETSAVGRALAFFGLAGTEIASADEVANAIEQQNKMKVESELVAYNALVKKHIYAITEIKGRIEDGDFLAAVEAWHSIPKEDAMGLAKADTKGGIFTTKEVRTMKEDPKWAEARRMYAESLKEKVA